MKIYKKIALIILLLSFGFVANCQSESVLKKVSLLGNTKFKDDLQIRVTASNLGNNDVSVNIRIVKGAEKFNVYLFDDEYKKGTNEQTWKDSKLIISWFQNKKEGKNVGINGIFNQEFDGRFMLWNKNRLSHNPFTRGYWMVTEYAETTRFKILNGDISKGNLDFTYNFFVTEVNRSGGETFIGISNPFTIVIPNDWYEASRTVATNNAVQTDPLIDKWNDEVNNNILITFLNGDCYSYQDVARSKTLKDVYDKNNTNEKIIKAIADITRELSDSKYRAERTDLIFKLERFKKPEEVIIAEKPKPTVSNNQQAAKTSTNKSTADPYASIRSSLRSAQDDINYVREQINWLENHTVSNKISELTRNLEQCKGNFDCFSRIKDEYATLYKGWMELLDEYSRRLDKAVGKVNAAENDKSFRASGISTVKTRNEIVELQNASNRAKQVIDNFNKKVYENLLNTDAFNKVVNLFKPKSTLLQQRLLYAKKVYNDTMDKLYSGRELTKDEKQGLSQIRNLLDSISGGIDNVLAEAKKRYLDETGSKPLPESLFISEIQLPDKKECSYTKADIDVFLKSINDEDGYLFQFLGIILVLFIGFGAYIYFRAIIRRKVSMQGMQEQKEPNRGILSEDDLVEGMEILDDNDEKLKAKGLDIVRKLNKIKYYEFDVQSVIKNTAVRHVYFSNEFIIDSYEYFQDKMVEVGSENLDSLYEYGGYIIGRWDVSLYDDEQYDISLEHFIKPGDDAKFSKFNIDFGYQISFNMETKLIDLAKHDNEQVLVGWLHSHPGHNVFLSNYDIEVQERFRNQYHPNRHVALVFDPNTIDWEMGLFTFNKEGVMNNKDEVSSLMNFHHLYDWALGKQVAERIPNQFRFVYAGNGDGRENYSFDKQALSKMKRLAAKKLKGDYLDLTCFDLQGVIERAGKLGLIVHSLDINDNNSKLGSLVVTGIFGFVNESNSGGVIPEKVMEKTKSGLYSFAILYNKIEDNFLFIPIQKGEISSESKWKEFNEKDYLPFLTDSSITI